MTLALTPIKSAADTAVSSSAAMVNYSPVLSKKAITAFFELGPQSVLYTSPIHWYRVRKAYLNSWLR